MTVAIMRCLLCDRTCGTFRRVKPEKIYVCTACIKTHGPVETIAANIQEYVLAFRTRHADVVLR